ncbi:hypothetical protein DE146DRAFT_762463 [Phaeosphaeria sp. MPI-PUGE-AT-0046c]|nr:hypothetical protein DE146DRAFT_762463 [Phaeosphaeria sp. MPI-PUGE-AT-0046c]
MTSGILGSTQSRLPTELVILIVEHLANDCSTLARLARTCRALQALAEQQLYKTISLLTVRDFDTIIRAFIGRPDRIRAVHTLRLQYHYSPEDLNDTLDTRCIFNAYVANMVNLREWNIESPYDNNSHWTDGEGPKQWVKKDMNDFRGALERACQDGPPEAHRIQAERHLGDSVERSVGLALLERLTIHSHGEDSEFWHLGDFHCLFRHPALRYLHVSCVSFLEDVPALRNHTTKTPLNTLIFDECEINPGVLKDILHIPAKLKHLTLGENVWNTRRSMAGKARLTKNAQASIDALLGVAHSLETLVHWDPSWKLDMESHKARRMLVTGDGMRNFHALKYMQCETNSFLHQAVIMNHSRLFEHLPEIETYLALPSLSTLEFMQSAIPRIDLSTEEYICDPDRLRNRQAYAYKLHKAGINLKMLLELHRGGLIPPYLHGEAQPITDCVYDAREFGFLRLPKSEEFDPRSLKRHWDDAKVVDDEHMDYDLVKAQAEHDIHQGQLIAAAREKGETDQLYESDILELTESTRSILTMLKSNFVRYRRLRGLEELFPAGDEMDDFDIEDPFAVDMDGEFDGEDLDMDDDDMSVIFHEHNGELYIEVYESETDTDTTEEDDDDVDDEAMEDLDGNDDLD